MPTDGKLLFADGNVKCRILRIGFIARLCRSRQYNRPRRIYSPRKLPAL